MATASIPLVLRVERDANSLWTILKQWRARAADGKPLAVTVSEFKSKRTLEQNSLLHVYLTQISENARVNGQRYDIDQWKEYYRRRYIGLEEIDLPDGTRIERGMSTTGLDIGKFANFLTAIEAHAATELGVELI